MSKYADDIAAIRERTKAIQDDVAEIKQELKELNGLRERVAIIETKQSIWGAAQAVYSTLAMAIAAYIGTRR